MRKLSRIANFPNSNNNRINSFHKLAKSHCLDSKNLLVQIRQILNLLPKLKKKKIILRY